MIFLTFTRYVPSNIGNTSADEDSDNEDVHNRFSHYKHLHCETTHHIRCPGYIEDFRVDLKALLTTKVRIIFDMCMVVV